MPAWWRIRCPHGGVGGSGARTGQGIVPEDGWGRRARWSPCSRREIHRLCPWQTTRRRTMSFGSTALSVAVSARAGTNLLDQFGDLFVDLAAFLHLPGDLVDGVDDRRVVPLAEHAAD